jgi:hypothetical protein
MVTDSSNVSEVAFDRKERVMRVRFSDGREYRYKSVLPEDFGLLVASDSVGKQFNSQNRRGTYGTGEQIR